MSNELSVSSPAPEFGSGKWSIEEIAGIVWLNERRNVGASGKEIAIAYGIANSRVYQIINKALAEQRRAAMKLARSWSVVDLLIDVAGWGMAAGGPESLSLMGLLMDMEGDPPPGTHGMAEYQRFPPQ